MADTEQRHLKLNKVNLVYFVLQKFTSSVRNRVVHILSKNIVYKID